MTSAKETLLPIQPSLWKENPKLISPEEFLVGQTSDKIFTHLFNQLEISEFSYAIYNPDSGYHEHLLQKLSWLKWENTDLVKMSDRVFDSSMQTIYIEEIKQNIILCNMLAVTSKVKIDDSIWQIPMLDFDIKKSKESIQSIKNMHLPPGLILETDNSYHYIGLTLMTDTKWKKWIKTIQMPTDDTSESLMNDYSLYIDVVTNRGYAGIRIKGYSDTNKSMTPKIIAKTY